MPITFVCLIQNISVITKLNVYWKSKSFPNILCQDSVKCILSKI